MAEPLENKNTFPNPDALFRTVTTAQIPPEQQYVGSLRYYQNEVERLALELEKCKAERVREKERIANIAIHSEQTYFEVEQRTRENADRIIAEAKAKAEKIITAADTSAARTQEKLSAELAALNETLINLSEGSELAKKASQEQFRFFDKSLQNLSDILRDTRDPARKSEPPEDDGSSQDDFVARMQDMLHDVPGPEYVSNPYPRDNPHRPIGE